MKLSFLSSLLLLAASASAANQFARPLRLVPPVIEGKKISIADGSDPSATNGVGFFTQLLNHDDPSAGTFQQRYFWNAEFWKGPGSPVILTTPGEDDADSYTFFLTNYTIFGRFAQELGGAVVMVEHRYWGKSSPYDELDAETLQQLTTKNAIADFVNIAKTIDLPFDTNHSSNAGKAPWVFSGGSYAGVLAAWTELTHPGTFWAYHASSAPVEAVYNFWEWYYPIQQGMPRNCSTDIGRVIDHVDRVLTSGLESEVNELKALFGLESVKHNDDFAAVIVKLVYLWQSQAFYSPFSLFYYFCDTIEGVAGGAPTVPGPHGVGLKKALANYAAIVRAVLLPGYCANFGFNGTDNTECFNTYDPNSPIYTASHINDELVTVTDRQFVWMTCNEPFAYWKTAPPLGRSTIVSRLITAEYYQRQCGLYFPEVNGFTYGSANPNVNTAALNARTQGWNLDNTTRLVWTNGEFDSWRSGGVSSQFRPGGPMASTAQHPIHIIPGGFHCSDLVASDAEANAGVQTVVDDVVAQIVAWVKEFYSQ